MAKANCLATIGRYPEKTHPPRGRGRLLRSPPAAAVQSGLPPIENNPESFRVPSPGDVRAISPTTTNGCGNGRIWGVCGFMALRNGYASIALVLGQGLPTIGDLATPAQLKTTGRHAPSARQSVHAAAERIGDSVAADNL